MLIRTVSCLQFCPIGQRAVLTIHRLISHKNDRIKNRKTKAKKEIAD